MLALFSRFRKKKRTEPPPPELPPPPPPPAGPPAAAARVPPPKGDVTRPKPRRRPYTGPRLKIYVPGRAPNGSANMVPLAPRPAPQPPPAQSPAAAEPDPALCPTCGARSPGGGGLCDRCKAQARLTETENLISSLRSKGVEVMPAERFVFQARSAMALDALNDVELLCERAEAIARQLDSDHDEARDILSKCESMIAAAIESGKETAAAERSLERATGLFRQGEYSAAMEQAALIPLLIAGRVEPGEGAAPTEKPSVEASSPSPTPVTPHPGAPVISPETRRCPSCGERAGETGEACPRCGSELGPGPGPEPDRPAECPICGEPLEPDWKSCPNCSSPIEEDLPLGFCPSCGREMMPKWKICPYCDADIPKNEERREIRPRATRAEKRVVPEIPPALRERGLLERIEDIDRLLDNAAAKGLDVTKGRNLLDLAVSFTRSRNYEKGERYVRKARNVAETMLSV